MINLRVDSRTCQKNPVVTISSNINEVFRAVLKLFIFYDKKVSHAQKAQKAQKTQKPPKAPKVQKAQKAQKTQISK